MRQALRYSIRFKLTVAILTPLVTAVALFLIIGFSTLLLGAPDSYVVDLEPRIYGVFFGIIFLVTMIGVAISAWLGSSLSRPIKAVEEGARLLALGEHIPDIVVGGHDEISIMAEEFNIMKHRLIERECDILLLNSTLEEKVMERTAQLEEKSLQLVEAQKELARAERLAGIGLLASGVAHEINNPLAIIRGNAELLELSAQPDGDLTEVETIIKQVGRMERIVSNLLTFARTSKMVVRSFRMRELLDDILDQVGHQVSLEKVGVTRSYQDAGVLVVGDEDQLRQVFTNLVINALQAMPDGGELAVTAACDVAAGRCRVVIADSGVGIADDAREKLFTPFFTTRAHGTGLGLAVSYGIVKDHGGEISVESAPGQGARFMVTLPLQNQPTVQEQLPSAV
jgi:two-component system NtrC family sensor kinase